MLFAQVAVAGGSDDGKNASLQRQIASLQRQINELKAQVDAPATAAKKKKSKSKPGPRGPAGPQGAQGPPGSAPACQGNGATDIMVSAGSICIDRYEASVWSSPTGGTQYGASSDDYPAGCTDTGQGCTGANAIYARSVAGVTPSRFITYFQAQQALANSGKRLPTNAEWQQAVAGTPDTTDCNVGPAGSVASTGSFANCVSTYGASDMVGNLLEWVADWVPTSTDCNGWGSTGTFSSDDDMCLAGASTTTLGAGAVQRGGNFAQGTLAGPFAVRGTNLASGSTGSVGFRGAR